MQEARDEEHIIADEITRIDDPVKAAQDLQYPQHCLHPHPLAVLAAAASAAAGADDGATAAIPVDGKFTAQSDAANEIDQAAIAELIPATLDNVDYLKEDFEEDEQRGTHSAPAAEAVNFCLCRVEYHCRGNKHEHAIVYCAGCGVEKKKMKK